MKAMEWTKDEVRMIADARAERAYIYEHVTEELLGILERKFETELPCFQGKAGGYDPLDAMRRDAQREVVLWLRHARKQHELETQDNGQ